MTTNYKATKWYFRTASPNIMAEHQRLVLARKSTTWVVKKIIVNQSLLMHLLLLVARATSQIYHVAETNLVYPWQISYLHALLSHKMRSIKKKQGLCSYKLRFTVHPGYYKYQRQKSYLLYKLVLTNSTDLSNLIVKYSHLEKILVRLVKLCHLKAFFCFPG